MNKPLMTWKVNRLDQADAVIQQLKLGNKRFVKGETNSDLFANPAMRPDLKTHQSPVAIILGCSDSRVPPEAIFDQGLGELFVVRVAGNIATPTKFGSIEFAVEKFGTPVVVVLGHSDCGAVTEAVKCVLSPDSINTEGFTHKIVDWILPSIHKCQMDYPQANEQALVDYGVKENVMRGVESLTSGSPFLKAKIESGLLKIVGAEYSLKTGKVHFF